MIHLLYSSGSDPVSLTDTKIQELSAFFNYFKLVLMSLTNWRQRLVRVVAKYGTVSLYGFLLSYKLISR